MELFQCPYLDMEVELSDNKERHIITRHADLFPHHLAYIVGTLGSPDVVLRKTPDDNTTLFFRWYYGLCNKYMAVVVVMEPDRKWVITAYPAHRLHRGEILWQRN